ncbi:interferon beta [Pipistrellus kuhlii]|uniref:Interferon beta 1 n=1 Tax=Pipistrellus kuhlii TaxID=59472 RepID=A0A7J7W3A9_PIPKU|nr:interferon beta [Pipistrellus kuhlii]KAF6331771.1 interferon beta 1 [Pipistrellus kuhlii]
MTSRCPLRLTILLCLAGAALSVNYGVLRFQLQSSTSACRELLRQLIRSPQYCLADTRDFQIPEEVKQPRQVQKEEAMVVMHEMLQQIFSLFCRNFSSPGWNETVMENLLEELHWQMDRLEEAMQQGEFPWESRTVHRLKTYYLGIIRYLKAKSYSRCAWTVVQVAILKNFSFLNGLIDALRD